MDCFMTIKCAESAYLTLTSSAGIAFVQQIDSSFFKQQIGTSRMYVGETLCVYETVTKTIHYLVCFSLKYPCPCFSFIATFPGKICCMQPKIHSY